MSVIWTLPFDLVVALQAAPLAPWMGWHAALSLILPFQGPLWLCAAALSTGYLCTCMGLRELAPWAGFVTVCSPALQAYSQMGRLSHHVASTVLATLVLATAVRHCQRPAIRTAVLTGLGCALLCWQSIETLPAVLAAWLVLVLCATLRGRVMDGAIFGFAAAMGALLAVVCDPDPNGILATSTDRLSLFSVFFLATLGLAATCAAWTLKRLVLHDKGVRLLWAAMTCTMVLGLFALSTLAWARFPADLSDPYVRTLLWHQDVENRSLLETRDAWPMFLPCFPALIWLAWKSWQKHTKPISLAFGVALFLLSCQTFVGLASVRLIAYSAALSSVACAIMLRAAITRLVPRANPGDIRLVFFSALLVVSGWLLVQGVHSVSRNTPAASGDTCGVAGVADAIKDALPPHSIVAAEIWLGPELLWTTPLRTIAGPYHRNLAGLGDLARIFMLPDQDMVRQILENRGAVAVLACASPGRTDSGVFGPYSLQTLIEQGYAPLWLRPIELPVAAGDLRLYRIVPNHGLESRQDEVFSHMAH